MSRYTPIDDLMLAIHEQVIAARATRDRPLTRGQINASHKECGAIVGQALDQLVDGGLLATMRLTRDSTTHDFYWPTGLKPITPPTDEERRMSTESKTDRLVRLITTHGSRINAVELSAKAKAEGYDIPAKNVQGLLTARVNRGDIELIRDGKATYYDTPRKKTAESLDASEDDDAMPPTDPALLALANRELGNQLSAAQADQQAAERALQSANADLADICRVLDVPHAGEAVEAIVHLEKLADARADQDMGDLGRYRALLDQIAARLGCDTHDSIPAVLDSLLATRDVSGGRLALLTTHDMVGAVLDYLEPYVSEEDARQLVLTRVNRGDLEHCVLVRALFQARRQLTYGPIEAPAIKTLRG